MAMRGDDATDSAAFSRRSQVHRQSHRRDFYSRFSGGDLQFRDQIIRDGQVMLQHDGAAIK